jgi:hypothetical protein
MKESKKTVIVVTNRRGKEKPRVYGNFILACKHHDFPYHSLKMIDLPMVYKGFTIHKVERITGDSRKK